MENRIMAGLTNCWPDDRARAVLVGRMWIPELGPTPIAIRDDTVVDVSEIGPTVSDLLDIADIATCIRTASGLPVVCTATALLESSHPDRRCRDLPHLLAPCDLQAVKACGVTFASSLIERVIEERSQGDPDRAAELRDAMQTAIGSSIKDLRPGSEEASATKAHLQRQGLWSQYLEVAIGPDAEVFTKCQPMAAVGHGAEVGVLPDSQWSNPEAEIVLAVNAAGDIVGATLGNDVNHRDIEGRSALLLGKAKDNNASCAIGPFIRLFDDRFGLDDLRQAVVVLEIRGLDGFVTRGESAMTDISRDPEDLVGQALACHQYPDGMMLFLGTMYVPTEDRVDAGQGFTHHAGDIVTIHASGLGSLTNRVTSCDEAPEWSFGTRDLMWNLAARGLLQ